MSRQRKTQPARGAVATVHPWPQALDDVAANIATPYDLDLFAPRQSTRAQNALAFLARLQAGDGYGQALEALGIGAAVPEWARRKSQWYAAAFGEIERVRRAQDVADVERVMVQAARGQVPRDKTRYAPDVRAAQLFLSASSERYRPGVGSTVPPVAIQINL